MLKCIIVGLSAFLFDLHISMSCI